MTRKAASVGLMAVACAAAGLTDCSGKTTQAGGLELVIQAEGLRPGVDFDSIEVKVEQETSPGQWHTLMDVKRLLGSEVKLPAQQAIQAGTGADQDALITVTALSGTTAIVQRVVQVQVPTNRVAELVMALAADCRSKVGTCGTGMSCQPDGPLAGQCGSNLVETSTLHDYGAAADAGAEAQGVSGSADSSPSGSGSGSSSGTTGSSASSGSSGSGSSSAAGLHGCVAGGCNATAGICAASGQACYCMHDSDCKSGKCVAATGKNDLSCGSNCTGAGAVDGFQCMLGGTGIPASCSVSSFAYTPSNLASLSGITPSAPVNLTCAGTVTFNGSAWSGATCSQTLPAPRTITQSGGPSIDVLAVQSLTIASGVTVNFTGTNAVMILVFGDASVAGAIHADGASGVSNRSTPGASGPGGAYVCGSSAGGTGQTGHSCGGGGGGAQTAGGAGAGGIGGTGGSAGSVSTNTGLRGGCPGGASGDWACTTSGGGGGGALQVSVAGTLTLTGTITANGGAGGTATCSSGGCAPGPNHTYSGGGGGGGAGGMVLLEGATVTNSGTVTVNGGTGGNPDSMLIEQGMGGAGATTASQSGSAGTGYTSNGCGSDDQVGGGGGGGYGVLEVSSGKQVSAHTCATGLTPAPVCNAARTGCLCVADTNCSSGKCANVNGQCTGTCTGTTPSGTYDVVGCQLLTSN